MRLLLAAMIFAATPTLAAEPVVVGGGVICDDINGVIEYIENPEKLPANCGVLRGMALATITKQGEYHHKMWKFNLVRYDFVNQGPGIPTVQYGFFGQPERETAA